MTVKRVICVLMLMWVAIMFSGCASPYESEDTPLPPSTSNSGGGGCH